MLLEECIIVARTGSTNTTSPVVIQRAIDQIDSGRAIMKITTSAVRPETVESRTGADAGPG